MWDMTPAEILYNIREYNKRYKELALEEMIKQYSLSKMIATFTNMLLGGKQIPSIQEVLPNIKTFSNKDEEFKDAHNGLSLADWNRMMLAKEKMIDFANMRNKKLKEGKNNG